MQAIRKISVLVLTLATILAACAPQQATQSAADVQAQVSTSVAMTVSAQNAETAAAQPQATATTAATQASLPTLTALPTVTPFVAPTPVVHGSGGGGGAVAAEYSCNVDTRPWDLSKFAPGDDFDVDWTIINTGTKTWAAGLDLTYLSGPNFTVPAKTFVQLPEVKPGGSFHVVYDAKAPTDKGKHVMTWKLQGGFCYPYIAIIVK